MRAAKKIVAGLALLPAVLLPAAVAIAGETMIEVYRGGVSPIRVAVPVFQSLGDQNIPEGLRRKMSERLRSAIDRTGYLRVVEPKAYIENPENVGVYPAEQVWSNWSVIGADALVKGAMGYDGEEWVVELRLYDVGLTRFRFGRRYRGGEEYLLRMADRFADTMNEELAGAEGIATASFAYVSDANGLRDVYVMNIDGSNNRQLTDNGSVNVYPYWTRSGQGLLYTTYYRRGKPQLYYYELISGYNKAFRTEASLSMDAVESPDGKLTAFVQDDGQGNTHLWLYDKKTRQVKQLNFGYGLTSSPSWSPDGKQIVYVNDRSGSPQLYILSLQGGEPRRLTFETRYNVSPAWSPKGNEIAFVSRTDGRLNLYLIDTQGANLVQLTRNAGDNEDPGWSPGGDYLIYSSNRAGNYDLYLMGAGGHFEYRLTRSKSNEMQPSWAPPGTELP